MNAVPLGTDAWLIIAGIAAWFVVMALKTLGTRLEHETRLHEIVMQAKRMRAAYYERRRRRAEARS